MRAVRRGEQLVAANALMPASMAPPPSPASSAPAMTRGQPGASAYVARLTTTSALLASSSRPMPTRATIGPLLKLDAGRLYEKYVGESEKNFRRATSVAEAMAPVVLWIDEIEKAFASGTAADADGGLSQRLFASFLTWLQEKKDGVFVVGAANDVTKMPPELLRKGRFDEIFFVDLPSHDERMSIFAIHLRTRKQDVAQFDLGRLAEASDGFSGAEIEQAVIASLYRALHAKQPLTTGALLDALRATVPLSVSRREDIQRLRAFASGRFTPVS